MKYQWLKHSVDSSVRESLWQYFMDHSKLQKNGFWGIMFYVKNEDDFWRRVEARYRGDFKRYDIEEKKAYALSQTNFAKERAEQIQKMYNGTFFDKFMVFIYKKVRNYVFKNAKARG